MLLGGLTIAALSLFVVSCGDPDNGEGAGTTSSETSATSSSSTTETDTSSSSETSETSDSTETSVSTNELADGSGCTPPSDTDLPDGRWYGLIDEAGNAELDFDLACFFTGDAAAAAAAEDGEESPPPNDYYVRNANDLLRTLEVATEAPVTWYPDGGSPTEAVTTYSQWLTDRGSQEFGFAVWLTISTGTIVEIEEQWVP